MLGRILKVEKNVKRSVVRIEKKKILLGRLWLFGNGKTRLLFGRLWNAVIKWKWSTATTVPSPLSFTAVLTDEPLRTEHNLGRSVFENIFDNFLIIVAGKIPETIRASVQTVHRVAKWKKMFFVFRGNSHCVFQWKSEKAETFFSLVHLFNVTGNNKTEPEHWYRELWKIEEHTKIRDKRRCGPPRLPPPVLPPPPRPPPHASNN